MKKNKFKYIYGPVYSWRLGRSLGVDLLSQKKKICSFDCTYCQVGKTTSLTTKRKVYVPTEKVLAEIKRLPRIKIDYITFSGRGEPTLASNLGRAIKAIKKLRPEPVAVLTNASLLHSKDVRLQLAQADLVSVKLDVSSQKRLQLINHPAKAIKFTHILKGIKQFAQEYKGRLAVQIMLMPANRAQAKDIARLVKQMRVNQVQMNTPKRKSAVKPLSRKAMLKLKRHFRGIKVASVYQSKRKQVRPISKQATSLRRS